MQDLMVVLHNQAEKYQLHVVDVGSKPRVRWLVSTDIYTCGSTPMLNPPSHISILRLQN